MKNRVGKIAAIFIAGAIAVAGIVYYKNSKDCGRI